MSTAPDAAVLRRSAAARVAMAVGLLPAILLAIDGWLDVLSIVPSVASTLAEVLPLDPTSASLPILFTGALGAFLLSIALARRKHLAWSLGVVVLICGALQQGLLQHHPIGAAVAVVCIVILLLDRRRYDVMSPAGTARWIALLGIAGVAAPLALAATSHTDVLAAAQGLAAWLAMGDPSLHLGLAAASGAAWGLGVARLLFVLLLLLELRPVPEPMVMAESRDHARDIALRYGLGALWPYQISEDKQLLADAGRGAVLSYGRSGRLACLVGDPMGKRGDAWDLFSDFLELCHTHDWIPAVYQASPEAREPLLATGFRLYRIGQEAVLPLTGFNMSGSRRANLRHTITRARKGGVNVTWHPEGLDPAEAERRWPSLKAIDDIWRRKAGPSLGFTIGRLERSTLERQPLSIADGADGKPIAFTTFLPTGIDNGWVLDLMRRVPGGVPGALEWCVAEAATALGQAGESTLSLSLAPLAGIGGPGAPLFERGLAVASRLIRRFYDVRGLSFFKEKFDVRWEPRYLAVQHLYDLPSVGMGLLALHLRRHGS